MLEIGQIRIWTKKAEGTSLGKRIRIESMGYLKNKIIISYTYPIHRKDGHVYKRDESFILRHSSLFSPVLQELFE